MLQARRRILIALFAASGLSLTAQETSRDPGAVVLLAESDGHTADPELQRALLDPDPRTRAIAARVMAAGNHVEIRGSIIGAMLREKDPDAGAELVRAALLLGGEGDLPLIDRQAARIGARAVLAKAEWLARNKPAEFLAAIPTLAKETEGLGSVVGMAAAQHPSLRTKIRDAWKPHRSANDRESRPRTARTVDLPGGVVAATLRAAGCRSVLAVGEAVISYVPDGRPRQITLTRGSLIAACVNALSALARLSFADTGYPVSKEPQIVVVPLHEAYVQCDSQRNPQYRVAQDADAAKIVVPRLSRQVKPDYSRAAMDHRVEGVVELSARVSEQGCVEQAEVTRTLPYLDVQALLAVTQWSFEPARLDGVGIPVWVSIELTFKMK